MGNYCSLSAERSDVMALETHFGLEYRKSEVVGKGDSMHEAQVSGLRNHVNRGVFNTDTHCRQRSFIWPRKSRVQTWACPLDIQVGQVGSWRNETGAQGRGWAEVN